MTNKMGLTLNANMTSLDDNGDIICMDDEFMSDKWWLMIWSNN